MNMDPSPVQDDRLSAYLDGELSSKERVEFELLLDKRQDYRDALHALRVVRDSLRAIPRETIGPDFVARVSRSIRENPEMNSESAPDQILPKRIEIRAVPQRVKRPRKILRLASLALATAAIILIFLRIREDDAGPQLAKRVGEKDPARMAEMPKTAEIPKHSPDDNERKVDRFAGESESIHSDMQVESRTAPAPDGPSNLLRQELILSDKQRDASNHQSVLAAPPSPISDRSIAPMDTLRREESNNDMPPESNLALDAIDAINESGDILESSGALGFDRTPIEIVVQNSVAWEKLQGQIAAASFRSFANSTENSREQQAPTLESISLEVTGDPVEIAKLVADLTAASDSKKKDAPHTFDSDSDRAFSESLIAKISGSTDEYRSLNFAQLESQGIQLRRNRSEAFGAPSESAPKEETANPGKILVILRYEPGSESPNP